MTKLRVFLADDHAVVREGLRALVNAQAGMEVVGEAGVGYVLKRSAAQELVHALRTVAAGGIYLDPSLAGKVVGTLVGKRGAKDVVPGGELSEREEEVVRLIAQGYSNKEIAARLEISVKTVETYKARSLQKLGLHSRADLVRYALQQGWLQQM